MTPHMPKGIALKAGKDWSGRMVNISTENVLIEQNVFNGGHGIAVGSETSGWVRDVTVRENTLHNIEAVVRMKSMRGRGGGAERLLYERISGNLIGQAIQINLNYKKTKPTNASATPVFRDITVRNIAVSTNGTQIMLCDGLKDSPILNLTLQNVTIAGDGGSEEGGNQECDYCKGSQNLTAPKLCVKQQLIKGQLSQQQHRYPAAEGMAATAAAPSHLKWLGFYGCDPATQHGWTSLCISENRTLLATAAQPAKMHGMAQVTWAFFMNAVPPRKGLMLKPDYEHVWRMEYWGCNSTFESRAVAPGSSSSDANPLAAEMYSCNGMPCLRDLYSAGAVFGVFLGDELLAQGINVTELTIAASTVKEDWPEAVVYWNEAWDPVVNNNTYPNSASALNAVPDAIDWISLDFYREDATAWTTPEQAYRTELYPKMKAHQRALQVPQAFGRTNDVCGIRCYMNATQKGCCTDNHKYGHGGGGSGQHNHTFEWWDTFSATAAQHYYEWAVRDPMIVGINPWYYGNNRPDITCGGYNISVSHLPTALAAWKEIGNKIVAGNQ